MPGHLKPATIEPGRGPVFIEHLTLSGRGQRARGLSLALDLHGERSSAFGNIRGGKMVAGLAGGIGNIVAVQEVGPDG